MRGFEVGFAAPEESEAPSTAHGPRASAARRRGRDGEETAKSDTTSREQCWGARCAWAGGELPWMGCGKRQPGSAVARVEWLEAGGCVALSATLASSGLMCALASEVTAGKAVSLHTRLALRCCFLAARCRPRRPRSARQRARAVAFVCFFGRLVVGEGASAECGARGPKITLEMLVPVHSVALVACPDRASRPARSRWAGWPPRVMPGLWPPFAFAARPGDAVR